MIYKDTVATSLWFLTVTEDKASYSIIPARITDRALKWHDLVSFNVNQLTVSKFCNILCGIKQSDMLWQLN